MSVDEDKVKSIRDFPIPKTIRQLHRFIGMAGWYYRSIKDYSTLTFPLTELLSKAKAFRWSTEAQKAFDLVKERLTTAPVLIHPDYNKTFILQCDASMVGIGEVLAQEDDSGSERPIAFISHNLNKSQRNYSITELESLAVLFAVIKFRPYIEGQEFKVVTDHASLKWIMSQKDLTGRLARWSLKLQCFKFDIEHRRRIYNVVPEALSRVHENAINTEQQSDPIERLKFITRQISKPVDAPLQSWLRINFDGMLKDFVTTQEISFVKVRLIQLAQISHYSSEVKALQENQPLN